MSEGGSEDDPLHPSRWRSNPDGPITGDELAYLKDLIHSRMGFETERFSAVTPVPPPGRWGRFKAWLRRR
ncbi:MAG: hypothetical protein KF730_02845 [Sphingomonas sp.]|uniref:hypothetical protein n=1 Tax=Sphingomonas sp. TaxID=28214 RepID=UPI002600C8D9|nr:hypothetical protein [Sphingomonas sp.]MBX3563494.1 hypothetical protein [Sphingomonas sp.]